MINMVKPKYKPSKDFLVSIINKYSNDLQTCINFFFDIKWPTGFYCEEYGCTHYYSLKDRHVFTCKECEHQHHLFANTVFQDNKLPLFKLILGLYLFFTSNKGIYAIEMASQLSINYKSALRLCNKCRVLMTLSNSEKILDSLFYEADTIYIVARSSNKPRNVN